MSVVRFFRQFAACRSKFTGAPELPFSEVLSQGRIETLLAEMGVFYRERVYTPAVTLWVFLSQVLSPDHSCRDAISQLLAFRAARGMAPCSSDTASYAEARQRLPEELISRLVRETGKELHQQACPTWHWSGRPIKLVDGSTVSMPDTPANEAAFGKPSNQRGKAGFPVARILIICCLATGAILEFAMGACRGAGTGELSLFRELMSKLMKGDILLGDRMFCSYLDIARLSANGVDVVYRQHASRRVDFRRGKQLGQKDHLVCWTKPKTRPKWMTREEFESLPSELQIREIYVRVTIPGYRVKSFVVVTTLTNPDQNSRKDLADLFRQRWHVETDFRSIKSVMKMDVLRCHTPQMIRKEIWVHFLAYHLIRSAMCAAALENNIPVRKISFKATLQIINAFHFQLTTSEPHLLDQLCTLMLNAIRQHRVANRPNRYEPRKVKRPAKPFAAMKKPRTEERKLCL